MVEQANPKQKLLQDIRQGHIQPERSRELWDNEERDELIDLHREGVGISEISLQLQRSEQAVVQQLIAMDLFTPTGSTRNRASKAPQCLCSKCQLPKSERPCTQKGGVCRNAGTVG